MTRFKLVIEYDGTNYVGWQRQPNLRSIQGSIEEAIEKFAQEKVEVQGSGRTDAGVHARGQVGHIDLVNFEDPYKVRQALNAHLSCETISIVSAEVVSDDFHARFSAFKRQYVYKIISRPAPLALEAKRAWHVYKPLDLKAMQEGAQHLIGRHDFSTFRAADCQASSPIKNLDKIKITQVADEISIFVEAPSFLHHQVRNIVGTLKLVAEGKWHPGDVATALDKKDRCAGGPTAPACGLYFLSVDYPL